MQNADLLDHTTEEAKVFHTRFRVPHAFFLELVKMARGKKWFSVREKDAVGRQGIPIELKYLVPPCKVALARSVLPVVRV
ncbi:unnamed protein product [Ectocarpus sp. CCAP 1310/34]|nr:unnamed protein product [Ectocarpus sp. CCAP 1310/34]